MATDLLKLRQLHPEWDLVDFVEAPNGGVWAMGRDGGVFSLNADGGTTGTTAPFHGSYQTELRKYGREGETNTFANIRRSGEGYQLVSATGQVYGQSGEFAPRPTAPVQTPAGPSLGNQAGATDPVNNESGRDVFLNSLVSMGFTRDQANSLGTGLWNSSKTKSPDALYFDLVNSSEYAARFPGMKALRDQGMALNEAQYINFERQYEAAAKSAGLPSTFYDSHDDFGKLIANGVSPDEYASRIEWAQTAAMSDPTFMEELAREVPGAHLGDATAFFLDPDRGTRELEQKQLRAQYSTSSRTTGFGALSEAEKNRLQAAKLTGAQANERFGILSTQSSLLTDTAEEAMSDNRFTREEAVGVIAGDAVATQELEQRRARRGANFQGGGGAAGGGAGKTGLG